MKPHWLSEIGVWGGPSLRGELGSSLLHGTVPGTGCMARMGLNPSYLLRCAYFLICPVTQLVSGTLSDRIAQRVTVYSAHPWEKWNSGSSCITILALSLFCIFHFSSSSILVFWCTFNFSFLNDWNIGHFFHMLIGFLDIFFYEVSVVYLLSHCFLEVLYIFWMLVFFMYIYRKYFLSLCRISS